ncbi:hypothetical protein [Rhizobium leucaenae]|uniref:hypothetical protein n=1 Tax=Rhizobium leucaenae TaxID=29450 RepID=UPI000402A15F|nr:hypothetical protein [Rhizobium leucaenae]
MDQVTVLEISTNVVEVAVAGPQGPTGPQGIQGPPGSNAWASITGKPTTVAGYGITDAETLAHKGMANGYAGLDSGGRVPAAQLPSYVDDVLEFANLGSFPATGSTGIIYVADDTGKIYRWSGSAYVEISPSPGSTDSVPEGSTNLYFTAARVLASVLTGLSTATNAVITASDTVLSALGKLQAQVSARVAKAGDTMTGALTAPSVVLNNAAGTERPIYFLTSGSNRWEARAEPSAETGANAGSDFQILRYGDNGSFLGAPFQINRATGLTTLESLAVSGPATASNLSLTGDFTQVKFDTHWRVTRDTVAGSDGGLVFQHSTDNFATAVTSMTLQSSGFVALNGMSANSIAMGTNGAISFAGTGAATTRANLGISAGLQQYACEGRLTLESGVPISTADQSAKTTLYFTPYKGDTIALYSGTAWVERTFVETSISLSTITTGKPYDVFAFDNAGTLALELAAWTNNTTRATALVLQNGVLSKSGSLTRRYLGTIYPSTAGQCADSLQFRYVWNYYNRVRRWMAFNAASASWTYNATTIRQAQGNTLNQLNFVIGVAEEAVNANIDTYGVSTIAAQNVAIGLGLDTTTAFTSFISNQGFNNTGNGEQIRASIDIVPAAGFHFLSWNEKADATGTATFFQGGMTGTIVS